MTPRHRPRTAAGAALRLLLIAGFALAALWPGPSRASAAPPRVTVFGDSVQASFGFAPEAVRRLGRGIDLRMQASVCRKLTSPGCLGGSPPSVLATARALGSGLGPVVVVHVGYNDSGGAYDIPTVLTAFRQAGVREVIWVTLRERYSQYRTTNTLIRAAARRQGRRVPHVSVADWNAHSVGRPWFSSDGIHLSATGAVGLADFLRPAVVSALERTGNPPVGPPTRLALQRVALSGPATSLAADPRAVWVALGPRLIGLDAASGRRIAGPRRLPDGATLVHDGGRAWVATGAEGLRPARAFASGSSAGVVSLAGGRAPVRAGGWLWSTVPCGSQPETCTQEVMLVGVTRTGRRQFVPLGEAGVTGIVGDSRALWLLRKPAAGGQSALERRDPATGTLLRTTRLPRRSRIVSASAGAVWIIRDRVLTRAGIDGRPRRALRGVVTARAVGDEVWAVRANRRDIVRLDPDDGRVRGLAVSPRRLSDTVLATRTHIWIVERGRRGMVVVPRPT